MSDRDPGFRAVAARWFSTIAGTRWTVLDLDALPNRAQLSAGRTARLGSGAWEQVVRVRWRLADTDGPNTDGPDTNGPDINGPDTDGAAEQRVWLVFVVDDDRAKIAGWADPPAGTASGAVPIWLLDAVTVRRRGPVVVTVAGAAAAGRWLERSAAAAAAVRRLRPAASRSWSGGLVVQVPATRSHFEQVLGVPTGSYDRIAAAAWSMGPDPATAPVHIVVNPQIADRLSEAGLAVLLAHETVHVTTHSVNSPAPTWLVEGYADQIAYTAQPETRRAAAEPLLREVATKGPPGGLPTDDDFEADAPGLDTAYAEAWLACRYIDDRWGRARLDRLYTAVDGGRPLAQAVPEVLGVSQPVLVRGWRADLRRLAEDRTW